METLLHWNTVDLEKILCSLVVETSLQAQKFILCFLLLCDGTNEFSSFPGVDHRFPYTELTKVQKPDAEAKDAGEADETGSDDDDAHDGEEEDDSGEEESDEEEQSDDDDAEANGDSESDEEDDDEEDDDHDDDNEEDDDDEEEDEDQREPPSKKKK